MQFTSLFIFTLVCAYSLVLSAPVEQKVADSPETKQQKATAIASRLLKELANEHQHESHKKEEATTNEEDKVETVPENQQEIEKFVPQLQIDDDSNDSQYIDITPIIDDLYESYGDNNVQLPEEEDSSFEIGEDDIYPLLRKQLLRYLAAQELANAHLGPSRHSQIVDDRLMAAEDH